MQLQNIQLFTKKSLITKLKFIYTNICHGKHDCSSTGPTAKIDRREQENLHVCLANIDLWSKEKFLVSKLILRTPHPLNFPK